MFVSPGAHFAPPAMRAAKTAPGRRAQIAVTIASIGCLLASHVGFAAEPAVVTSPFGVLYAPHNEAVIDAGKARNQNARIPDPAGPPPAARTRVQIGNGKSYNPPPRKRASSKSAASATHTIRLTDVTVSEAAAVILGDIGGFNYTLDPKIDGRVTIQTTQPVTKTGALALFDASLRNLGAATVKSGSIVRIVTADQATAGAELSAETRSEPEVGGAVKIIPLKYVSAAEMKRLIEPVASYGGVVRIDTTRNALLVAGSADEIASIRSAVAVFDVNILKGMSFALVPLRAMEPEDAADNLVKVFGTASEGAMQGMIQAIPNKRLRAVLIISRSPEYLNNARAWLEGLDERGAGSRKELQTVVLRNRQARDLVEVLNAMFASETSARDGRASRLDRSQQEVSGAPGFTQSDALASGGFTVGSSAGAGGLAPLAPARGAFNDRALEGTRDDPNTYRAVGIGTGLDGEARMKIVADPAQNALLILASVDDYKRVERVIRTLDVLPNQVLIEATIAEVTLNDELRFGVRWFFQNQKGSRSGTFSNLVSGAASSAFPGFSFVAKVASNQITLNALNDVTRVNVLASPSLMVLDKRTAVLQIGDQVPITTQAQQSISVPGAPIINSISYKDTGVVLSVTPRISEGGKVLLDIEQEVSTVARTTSSNIDSPTFGRRKVKTTVVVGNGESITLGGLIQDRVIESHGQVPILGDIPIIGNAFKEKQHTIEKTELVIMLTPRVVRDLGEAAAVTEEYRSRVRAFAPKRDPGKTILQNVKRTVQ